jgi:tetratricopeptide (TPR) repeat protein
MKLGRKEESFNAIHGAFRQDPHNAYTHANHGWGLLEKGSAKEALHHFTEALRIDPNLGLAQAGMMEALKARYFIYRIFLKYSFWMSNLTAKYQWGVTIGFFLIFKLVQWLARNSPSLEVYLVPVLMLWMAIALSTWIITPLSNLFLRLNKYGRHLLDRKEIISSNLVGASLLVAVAGISVFLIAQQPNWLTLFFYGITMMIPLGSMLAPSRRASVLVAYTAATGLVGAVAIATTFLTNNMGNLFSLIYVIGIFIYQWVANAMVIKQNNR